MKKTQVMLTEKELQYLLEIVERQEVQIKRIKKYEEFSKFVENIRKSLAVAEKTTDAARA